jgi:hypothetical protein
MSQKFVRTGTAVAGNPLLTLLASNHSSLLRPQLQMLHPRDGAVL